MSRAPASSRLHSASSARAWWPPLKGPVNARRRALGADGIRLYSVGNGWWTLGVPLASTTLEECHSRAPRPGDAHMVAAGSDGTLPMALSRAATRPKPERQPRSRRDLTTIRPIERNDVSRARTFWTDAGEIVRRRCPLRSPRVDGLRASAFSRPRRVEASGENRRPARRGWSRSGGCTGGHVRLRRGRAEGSWVAWPFGVLYSWLMRMVV